MRGKKEAIGWYDVSYVCTKCQIEHKENSSIGVRHKKYSQGIEGSGGKLVFEGQQNKINRPFWHFTDFSKEVQ